MTSVDQGAAHGEIAAAERELYRAFIDGIVDMRVGERGQPKNLLHLLFALGWVRQGGRWRLYYRQATRMSG